MFVCFLSASLFVSVSLVLLSSFVLDMVCLLSFFLFLCCCCRLFVFVFAICLGFCLFSFFFFSCFFSFFFPWPCSVACGLSVPWPGLGPPGWERQIQDAGLPENSWAQEILIGVYSPRGIHLDTKTWLHPTACRLQCWTPHAEQPARQEHSPTHQQTCCLKPY